MRMMRVLAGSLPMARGEVDLVVHVQEAVVGVRVEDCHEAGEFLVEDGDSLRAVGAQFPSGRTLTSIVINGIIASSRRWMLIPMERGCRSLPPDDLVSYASPHHR